MGAGSAKGLRTEEDDDDLDRYSNSSDQWDQDQSIEGTSKSKKQEHVIRAVTEIPPLDPDLGDNNEIVKKESKKRGLFKFSRRKESGVEKLEDESDDNEENEKKNKENKKNSEKNNKNKSVEVDVVSDKKGGFRLFGWGKDDKKIEEKEIQLDQEINDLEKTFDSLGIVGRNLWEEEQQNEQQQTAADDLALLEPMRKRKTVRTRLPNGIKSTPAINGGGGGSGGSSSTSRRTFKYSWETSSLDSKSQEEDAWDYKTVVIEGFDIEKFKRANKRDNTLVENNHYNEYSSNLPNSIESDNEQPSPRAPILSRSRGLGEPIIGKSSLFYDPTEQHLLATIERDFTV